MNVIARLEYELAYYDSAVHRFNHYTTRTTPKTVLFDPIDETLTDITSNSNDKVLHISQGSRTGASPSDGLVL